MKKLELFNKEMLEMLFNLGYLTSKQSNELIEIANSKLNDYIQTLPKVYLDKEENGWHGSEESSVSKTHTAYLIAMEPIKECPHKEAIMVEQLDKDETWFECDECGKRLVPLTWKVDE